MHDQPGATEEEQEQAPERLEEEEAQRGAWEDDPRQHGDKEEDG